MSRKPSRIRQYFIKSRKDPKRRPRFDWQSRLIEVLVVVLCVILLITIAEATIAIWTHRGYYGFTIGRGGPETDTKTNADLLFLYIEALAVFVGFGATLIQLRSSHLDSLTAEKWKRAEFVADEFRTFNVDRSVLNFKAILEAIAFDAPPRLQLEVVDPDNPDSEKTGAPILVELTVPLQQLMNAFAPASHAHLTDVETDQPLDGPLKWSPIEGKIANATDQFMYYLVNFSKLYRQEILQYEDLHAYLYYWFDLIFPDSKTAVAGSKRSQNLRRQLQRFLKEYYNGQTPERWEEGQCAFICAILAHSTEKHAESQDLVAERLYENTFDKIDVAPTWSAEVES